MPRFTVILLAASIATLLGTAGIARADGRVVYEWTDAHGEVHYTDQWVPGAKLVRVEMAPGASAGSGAMQDIRSESDSASHEIKQQDEARAVQQDEANARAGRCTKDKAEYQKLIESRRIFTTDKSGERHYLSDSEADALRVKARATMDADCGTGS